MNQPNGGVSHREPGRDARTSIPLLGYHVKNRALLRAAGPCERPRDSPRVTVRGRTREPGPGYPVDAGVGSVGRGT